MPPWPPEETRRHDLDAAIDRAVRDTMNVDADGSFRARVLARLERRSARTFGWPAAGAAGAAAAALVLAVAGMLGPEPTVPTSAPVKDATTPVAGASVAAPQSAPVVKLPERADAGQQPASNRRRLTAAATMPNVTHQFAPGALMATSVDGAIGPAALGIEDASTRIEPIKVEPISTAPFAPGAIVIAPLAPIAELQIAPLLLQIDRD